MIGLQERFKHPSCHAEFKQKNRKYNCSFAQSASEQIFIVMFPSLRRNHGHSFADNSRAGILAVPDERARYRSYRRPRPVGNLLVPHSNKPRSCIAAFPLVQALCLCTSLLIGSACASQDSFQEKYGLPQSPESLLQEILARDEFKEDETWSFIERLWEQFYRKILRLLARILKHLPETRAPQIDEQWAWMVVKMMLLGVAAVLAIYALSRILSMIAKNERSSYARSLNPEKGGPGLGGSGDSWDQALMLAQKGDYSKALVTLFRFAVLKLDEQGILLFHRGKTNREILECITDDSVRDIVADMIPSFNRVRYGKGSCDRIEYERFLSLCRRLAARF